MEESDEKLKTMCAQVVEDYIACAVKIGMINQDKVENAKATLLKSAQGAYYDKEWLGSFGAGPEGVILGENFREIIDKAKSANDKVLNDNFPRCSFSFRKGLFHEFTHVLQLANLEKENKDESFSEYKKSFEFTRDNHKCFSCLQEIAASLAEEKLWLAYSGESVKPSYYAGIVALGLGFLGKVKMTDIELVKATTFEPWIFEEMEKRYKEAEGKDFKQLLEHLDNVIIAKHNE